MDRSPTACAGGLPLGHLARPVEDLAEGPASRQSVDLRYAASTSSLDGDLRPERRRLERRDDRAANHGTPAAMTGRGRR